MHLSGMIIFFRKGRLRGAVHLMSIWDVYCQGHGSRSNVVVSYVKESHYATSLCGVV